MKHTALILTLITLGTPSVFAEHRDICASESEISHEHNIKKTDGGIEVYFRQGKYFLDSAFNDNALKLDEIVERVEKEKVHDLLKLRKVHITGGASPEGSVMLNKRLSERRADAIFNYLKSHTALNDSVVDYTCLGRDWEGLLRIIDEDNEVPYREEVISLVEEMVTTATPSTEGDIEAIRRLQKIGGGEPYRYLYNKLYPSLRESNVVVDYGFNPDFDYGAGEIVVTPDLSPLEIEWEEMVEGDVKKCSPFYMDLRTNLLYDALALPDIGAEFYLGKNFSIGANWLYGWWNKNSSHRYWRAYGGDINVRYWFGKAAHNKPLTGHHIGVYGGILTYDFEFGGKGVMGGLPGKTLWNRCNRFAGVEYGYSLPIGRRLNLDFTLGIGYFGGKYIKYVPHNNGYVWQSTHRLNWFGPTKAEISLVWLIGCDNYNRKGGVR